MDFYYYLSYDEKNDTFFALVDTGAKNEIPIFTINDTEEMVEFIKDGIMKHIDDVVGLEKYLIHYQYLKPGDNLILCETMLW